MGDFFRRLGDRRMLLLLFLGFSCGLPLPLVGGALKAWLATKDITLATIGLFSLVGLPYTLKFLWSPAFDKFVLPFLGRRRGWMFVIQVALIFAVAGVAFFDPVNNVEAIAIMATLIAFLGASQDIVVDAYRWEILSTEEYGVGTATFVTGYRIALLVGGSLALILADPLVGGFSWSFVYVLMALLFLVGIVSTLMAKEPKIYGTPPRNAREAVIDPFVDYLKRPGALWMLAFIVLYKLGDNMAAEMQYPFYVKMHYGTATIGTAVKFAGFVGTVVGAAIGGWFVLRAGLVRALWFCGILQAVSTVGFSVLAWYAQTIGPSLYVEVLSKGALVQQLADAQSIAVLVAVILVENLAGGMGTSAFLGFMGHLTNKKYTATQYALFSSLMGVPRVFLGSQTGFIAESVGWQKFFVICAVVAIPGLLLLIPMSRWVHAPAVPARETSDSDVR